MSITGQEASSLSRADASLLSRESSIHEVLEKACVGSGFHEPHQLCHQCNGIARSIWIVLREKEKPNELRWGQTHCVLEWGPAVVEFIRNAAQGCHMCAILLHHVLPHCKSLTARLVDLNVVDWHGHLDLRFKLSHLGKLSQMIECKIVDCVLSESSLVWNNEIIEDNDPIGVPEIDNRALDWYDLLLDDSNAALTQEAGSIGNNTDSEKSVSSIQKWLELCERNHDICHKVATQDFCPDRLLQIETKDGKFFVQLITSAGDRASCVKYTTLSHCWGSTQPAKLLRENLASSRGSRSVDELPKTFRDAVLVTFDIGLTHIWIDSLCIIQDSENNIDWLEQSSKMDRIYSNSFLNIAAAWAENSAHGLFHCRFPLSFMPCKLPEWSQTSQVPQRSQKYLTIMPFHESVKHYVTNSAVERRGWVLQETTLARTVFFAMDQIHWRCQEMHRAEAVPDHMFKENHVGANTSEEIPTKMESNPFTWYKFMKNYMNRRELSKPQDKLIAIAGLAHKMCSALNRKPQDYLAGLWRQELPFTLLWEIGDIRGCFPSRAPSWSFLRYDASLISFNIRQREKCSTCEIVDTSTRPTGNDPFGMIAGAAIRIRGFLIPIIVSEGKRRARTGSIKLHSIYKRRALGVTSANSVRDRDEDRLAASESWFLPIHVRGRFLMKGLLIEPTLRVRGEYERVLVKQLHVDECLHPSLADSMPPDAIEALEQSLLATGDIPDVINQQLYEICEDMGSGRMERYTISLV